MRRPYSAAHPRSIRSSPHSCVANNDPRSTNDSGRRVDHGAGRIDEEPGDRDPSAMVEPGER